MSVPRVPRGSKQPADSSLRDANHPRTPLRTAHRRRPGVGGGGGRGPAWYDAHGVEPRRSRTATASAPRSEDGLSHERRPELSTATSAWRNERCPSVASVKSSSRIASSAHCLRNSMTAREKPYVSKRPRYNIVVLGL